MRITDYSFGKLTLDGELYTSDLIILPDRVIHGWWRKSGHRLLPEDLEEVVADAPERLIVGTGAYGVMSVPGSTTAYLRGRGIEPIVLRTQEACDRFNNLSGEGRIAAALHLTC